MKKWKRLLAAGDVEYALYFDEEAGGYASAWREARGALNAQDEEA